jgi:3-hydroxyacyl-CoA dehydrogenase/enoyl-CoA hydratase/3-hydroxybutyryl-CoA epimerase
VFEDRASFEVVDRLLEQGRGGRLAGAGYYDYEDGKRAGLWKGLKELFPEREDPSKLSLRDLEERMLFIESIESVKCLDEGVIETSADANIGSILGIGFPGWTGGVLQYIDGYQDPEHPERIGPAAFVARARELAARYGERFEPPTSLVELADRGERYSERAAALASA